MGNVRGRDGAGSIETDVEEAPERRAGKAKLEGGGGERRRLPQSQVLSPACWSYWEYCTGSG